MNILKGYIVPGKPHPLLATESFAGYKKLNQAFKTVQREIESLKPDVILLFSTQWVSVLGHQVQTHPCPRFEHVDPEWHELGTMDYKFSIDSEFGDKFAKCARARGLHMQTVDYEGFPIDTGSVVALKLLNPTNHFKASIVSCNMYSDRAETVILGKAHRDALKASNLKAVAIAVTSLSNRIFTHSFDPKEDRIHSLKDDEWNRKILELLEAGRLEDVSQLAREFSQQANGDQKMKALWWLAGLMGGTNRFDGKVYEYQPICGSGAALVGLTPSDKKEFEREFDEQEFEVFRSSDPSQKHAEKIQAEPATKLQTPNSASIEVANAPKPVGAYPHARREGDFLFLSGVGPRDPKTNGVPGGPIWDNNGEPLEYDIELQTRSVIENVKNILAAAGSSLEKVVDVTVYLTNMKRDFETYNRIYAEYFGTIQATRTTLEISRLPTPIAIELKVIARP